MQKILVEREITEHINKVINENIYYKISEKEKKPKYLSKLYSILINMWYL